MTPAAFARRVKSLLRDAGDPATAETSRSFFKQHERVAFYGVGSKDLRRLEREAFGVVKQQWLLNDAEKFASLMIQSRRFEAKQFGMLVLARYKAEFGPALLKTVEGWLRANHCDNWAAVDSLCPLIVTPVVERFPRSSSRMVRWVRSRNLWVRRSGVVTFVPLARRGEMLDEAYGVVESLLADKEDLMHKACGWLLREAGKTDQSRLETFLRKNATAIPRTTVRYSIERFPERKRQEMLRVTRGDGSGPAKGKAR